MHIISIKPFQEAARKYPKQAQALIDAYRVLRKARFKSPDEMRKIFPSLDNFKYEKKWWVVDVGGNNLRLMAFIQFIQNRMYVKHILTHAGYEKICQKYRKGVKQ